MPVLPRFSPMLASTGPITDGAEGWAFEPKLDGWRALVYLDESLIVRARNDHDITASLPELLPMATALASRRVVLGGRWWPIRAVPSTSTGSAPTGSTQHRPCETLPTTH